MAMSLIHLNGNLLCSIDTETTGLIPGKHDIIQVAVVPLDSNLQPLKEIHGRLLLPFVLDIIPKRPHNIEKEAMRVNGRQLSELMRTATEPFKAADMFEEWFESLKLGIGKKIAPLGQNYPFDRGFLIDWLGDLNYDQFFDYNIRDTKSTALFLNDLADSKAEPCPYPKYKLSSLCERLGVSLEKAHDALADARATAEVYRRMILAAK